MLIDGNDPAAVYAAVAQAVAAAAAGEGPTLIEAITYRIEAHTNADDATRYRDRGEVESWLARDPLTRLRQHLTGRGLLDEAAIAALDAEAETEAAALRQRMNVDTVQDPAELFRYVYAEQTPALGRQQQELARELAESEDQ
jgi:2-oxoisovalerate dehydrogenase E1 component alpha subunit